MKFLSTIQGLMKCTVAEFKPAEYKGLHSGIGKERKSSKHYNCKKECCVKTDIVNALRKGAL